MIKSTELAIIHKIREEDKRDRLAVAKEKKKRYGVERLSKEENQRMAKRTEDRLEIAKAKENLWRKFRERKEPEDKGMEEEEEDAWKSLKKGIIELEEEGGNWRESAKEPRMILTSNWNPEDNNGNQRINVMEPEGVGHDAAEDKKEFGGKGSISPEKTVKALFNYQSGVRERVIKVVGSEVRGMEEHVAKEVMGSAKSVRNVEVKEVSAGVNGVSHGTRGAREVKEIMGSVKSARNVEVKEVTAGVHGVSHGTRGAREVREVREVIMEAEDKELGEHQS